MDINFKIEKDKLSSDITVPFSGNVNYYHCIFTFSDEWADLTKYAVFMVEDKAYTVEIIDNACIMPKEVLYKRCHVTAGVFGTNGASNDYIRISTNPICFFVNDGSYVDGETPEQPTPDIWEIYLQKVQNAANNAVPYIGSDDYWYVYDADKQTYVKTNILAKGQKGDKGDTGYTPIKGVDYFTSADIESLGIDQKQDKLTFDDTPTADSPNPVTSGGVKTALDKKADKYNSSFGFEGGGFTYVDDGGGAAIGMNAASINGSGAVGRDAAAFNGGGAVGRAAIAGAGFAGGYYATVEHNLTGQLIDAIQLGTGTNNNEKTLQIYDYQLMDADGNIPTERLNNAPKTEVIDNLTSADIDKALSANQGAELLSQITNISNTLDDKADKTEVAANDTALKEAIAALKEKSVPHTTVSGYSVSVSDHLNGEAILDYKVYGNSVQDGTPTLDTPVEIQSVGDLVADETSEYYGKYDVPVTVYGKNLLPYPYNYTTQTIDGITFTDNGDGSITLNGITTLSGTGVKDFLLADKMRLEIGTYTISGCPVGGGTYTYRIFLTIRDRNNTTTYVNEIGSGKTFTITDTSTVSIYIRIGGQIGTVNNLIFKPQLEIGNTATEYEQYSGETKHIYLNEPLRKVGDYADYIDFKGQKVMRQIEVLDDTGTKSIDESLGVVSPPSEEAITVPELVVPQSGTMNISATTSIKPSNIDLTYYQDINKVLTNLTNAILAQGGNV